MRVEVERGPVIPTAWECGKMAEELITILRAPKMFNTKKIESTIII